MVSISHLLDIHVDKERPPGLYLPICGVSSKNEAFGDWLGRWSCLDSKRVKVEKLQALAASCPHARADTRLLEWTMPEIAGL